MSPEVTNLEEALTSLGVAEDGYDAIEHLGDDSTHWTTNRITGLLSLDKKLRDMDGLGPHILRRLDEQLVEGCSETEAVEALTARYHFPKDRIVSLGYSALAQLAEAGFGPENETVKPWFLALGFEEVAPAKPDALLDTATRFRAMKASSETELSERAKILKSGPNNANLRDTEARILELVTMGLDKPAIARMLGLAENTVKAGLSLIYKKYGLDHIDRHLKPAVAKKIALDILHENIQDKSK